MPRIRLTTLAAAAFLAACETHPTDIRFEPPVVNGLSLAPAAASVVAGELQTFTLHNANTFDVGYNLCVNSLEVLVGGDAWGRLENNRVCTGVLYTLKAGESKQEGYTVPAELGSGTYRLSASFSRVDGWPVGYIVPSGQFEVRGR